MVCVCEEIHQGSLTAEQASTLKSCWDNGPDDVTEDMMALLERTMECCMQQMVRQSAESLKLVSLLKDLTVDMAQAHGISTSLKESNACTSKTLRKKRKLSRDRQTAAL